MKKLKRSLLCIAVMIFLTACGKKTEGDSGVKPEYVLNLGDVLSEDHPHSQSYYWFADRVSELTDGKVQVKVFVNSALGNQADLIEGLGLETVQIAKSMTTGLSVYCPEIQIFDLPYMFSSPEQFFHVIDGEIGDYYANDVLGKQNMVGIAYFYAGARDIYTQKPVECLADVKGMKLRVPESSIFMSLCDSFGCSGTPMAVGELYTALQTGVVDGVENAPIFYYSQKHYEAAPYLAITEHVITPDIVVMNKSYLESMPEEYQKAIKQAGREMMQYERELWISEEEKAIEKLENDGVKIIQVDKEEFKAAAEKVWESYTDVVGADMIDKIQSLKE